MRVLMVCHYPRNPSEIFGGTSAAAYNLVQALVKYKKDIDITTFSFWPGIKSNQFFTDLNNRIRIYRFPANFKYRSLINSADKRYFFRKVLKKEKPDIIHAQGEGFFASLAVNSGLPNVYTIHGVRIKELEMERESIGPIRYFLRKRLILNVHKKATNIVAINEYTKTQVAPFHNARVWVIRNAVDEAFFDLNNKEEPDIGNILLVGGVRRRKDIFTALKAVNTVLQDDIHVKLNIVGPVDSEYGVEANDFINSNNLNNNVIIHGLVDADKLMDLYLKADIFLLTSLEESSPISLVEAMAAGKPVVSTNVGGISEMVKNNKNAFLLDTKDDNEIAKSINTIVKDRKLRERFSAESNKIAKDSWSSKAVALETYKMYVEVLNGK